MWRVQRPPFFGGAVGDRAGAGIAGIGGGAPVGASTALGDPAGAPDITDTAGAGAATGAIGIRVLAAGDRNERGGRHRLAVAR